MEKNFTSIEDLKKIEEKYDPQLSFRTIGPNLSFIVTTILVSMSLYHFWASGFGLVREVLHRGIHISYVIGLVFIVFSWKKNTEDRINNSLFSFQNVSILDYIFAILTVASALYLPLLPSEILASRVGNPELIDVVMGSILIILTLEAARRSVGPTLPIISVIFILFAIFGPYAPGALKHGGTSWLGFVNHIYITNQGVYGIAVGVMAQYVFLFILFGVLATRVGLGKLFIDLAMLIAGKYSGGPAKVAIFSSAFMGTISGSSIANTVTTGSLTIPAMKKIGYPSHFAGAVEAASSTGGQITPPILGAAAFIMVEYLGLPLKDILAAALLPALFHYFGIFIMVHLEAKKLGLRGLNHKELPKFFEIMKDNWLSLLPLIILVYFILAGRTPDFAAIYGIISCVVVGILKLVTPVFMAFRDREYVLNLIEGATGGRFHPNFDRIGGLKDDLPKGWLDETRQVMKKLRNFCDEIEDLLFGNEIFQSRTRGIGVIPADVARQYGLSGANLRASGVDWDLRRDQSLPLAYDKVDFRVWTHPDGDSWARCWIRLQEVREATKIVDQLIETLPPGPVMTKVPRIIKVPEGEAWVSTENPLGEMGYYVVSKGDLGPFRVKIRSASFNNISITPWVLKGVYVPDIITILASLYFILGDIDR